MPPPVAIRSPPAAALCAVLAALAAATAAPPIPDQEPAKPAITRPGAAQRLVALFEFDKPEPYEIPRHWDLYRGNESAEVRFPHWNTASLDHAVAYRGEGSVRLSTSGGSVRLRLDPGVIPVFASNEYIVSARILTRDLRHARAAISARFLDSQSRPIAGTHQRSELIISRDDEWRLATVLLSGKVADAAFLQIGLELLQPQEYDHDRLGRHQVWSQDFHGHAWFDDVAVVQLPRVRMATSSHINVIEHPEVPEITIHVRDLTGESLTAQLLLQDGAGRVIASDTRPLRSGSQMLRWQPEVERFGWYRAILELLAGEQHVGATYVDFAWVPRRAAAPRDAAAFCIIVEDLPPEHMHMLPDLVHQSGAGSVTIPAWHRSLTLDDLPSFVNELGKVLIRLRVAATRIAFSFRIVPEQLARAAAVDVHSPAAIFLENQSVWSSYLIPLLDRFGQNVQRWQIASLPTPARRAEPHQLPVDNLRHVLKQLVPAPVVSLLWAGDLDAAHASHADELVVTVPTGLPADAVADFADSWSRHNAGSFLFLPSSEPHFSREDVAADLLRKTAMLWKVRTRELDGPLAGVHLALMQPWLWAHDVHGGPMPSIELIVWRNIIQRLSGRNIVGHFPAGPGMVALILAPADGSSQGAIVAWQNGPADPPVFEACLGLDPVIAIDMFGNETTIPPGSHGMHRITLSPHPIFLEGVDTALVRFLASVALDQPVLEPSVTEHSANIMLSNPWPTHLQGRITVLEPGGLADSTLNPDRSWRIIPRTREFALSPGQNAQLPLRIAFSAVEEHGPKDFIAEVELFGRQYPPIRVRSQLEVRSDDIDVELAYSVVPRGEHLDLILEATIINRSPSPATLELTAFAAEHPRARASISNLLPGATATRRFSFPDGGRTLRFDSIAVAVNNADTGARITRAVTIE